MGHNYLPPISAAFWLWHHIAWRWRWLLRSLRPSPEWSWCLFFFKGAFLPSASPVALVWLSFLLPVRSGWKDLSKSVNNRLITGCTMNCSKHTRNFCCSLLTNVCIWGDRIAYVSSGNFKVEGSDSNSNLVNSESEEWGLVAAIYNCASISRAISAAILSLPAAYIRRLLVSIGPCSKTALAEVNVSSDDFGSTFCKQEK